MSRLRRWSLVGGWEIRVVIAKDRVDRDLSLLEGGEGVQYVDHVLIHWDVDEVVRRNDWVRMFQRHKATRSSSIRNLFDANC